jgi:hypothetical protein
VDEQVGRRRHPDERAEREDEDLDVAAGQRDRRAVPLALEEIDVGDVAEHARQEVEQHEAEPPRLAAEMLAAQPVAELVCDHDGEQDDPQERQSQPAALLEREHRERAADQRVPPVPDEPDRDQERDHRREHERPREEHARQRVDVAERLRRVDHAELDEEDVLERRRRERLRASRAFARWISFILNVSSRKPPR